MYSGPLASSEEYLKGKEYKGDLEDDDMKKLREGTTEGGPPPGSLWLNNGVNPVLEEQNRLRDDPLMTIKMEEHKQRTNILSNPIKVKQIRKEMQLAHQLKLAMKERKKAMRKAEKKAKKEKKSQKEKRKRRWRRRTKK